MDLVELRTLPRDVDEVYLVSSHDDDGLKLYQLEKKVMIEVLFDYSKFSFELVLFFSNKEYLLTAPETSCLKRNFLRLLSLCNNRCHKIVFTRSSITTFF